MKPLVVMTAILGLAACGGSGGMTAPCGGGQYAQARAVLPDTGINASDTVAIGFLQRDKRELSELMVMQLPSSATGHVDPEPDPRVRIVREEGLVLLDSLGSRYNQAENKYNLSSWHVFTWIRDAKSRNALYDGFRNETLWIELWRVGAKQAGTRVQLRTERVGVAPESLCL